MLPIRHRPLSPFIVVVGTALVWTANLSGLWWVTVVAGGAVSLLKIRGRTAFGIAALIGALGWGLPLVRLALGAPLAHTADIVAGIMGLGSTGGPAVIVGTLLLGVAYCAAGTWVGLAVRLLFLPASGKA